jgi:parallel beta-helix repeat protein
MQKIVLGMMLIWLLIGMLSSAFTIQPVEASETIYIKADGSIDPPTAPINRVGNIYTLTSNIYGSIVVEKDNIMIDGADHSIQTEGYVWKGIDLTGRRNVTVKNLQIIGFSNGIYLVDSSGNTISGTDIIGGDYGLWIWNSSYNNICCNKITKHHEYGVIITFSNNNIISENNIEENGCGIYFEHSSNNILKGNILNENAENIHVAFQSLSDCVHDIDASNTVDGKPIYYWVNQQNKTVPSNAGYVALVNCTNIKVQNLKLCKNGQGILLVSTKDSVIANTALENNGYGILIFDSQNINITGNMVVCNQLEGFKAIFSEGIRVIVSNRVLIDGNYITETGTGIFLSGSTQVVISRNNITSNTNRGIECVFSNGNMIFYNYIWNNTYAGINLVDSDENRVIGNTMIENNGWGVRLSGADNNTFYHNNFINNKVVEGLQVSNP